MMDLIRDMAADLHSAAESLKAIKAGIDALLWVTGAGFFVLISIEAIAAVRLVRKRPSVGWTEAGHRAFRAEVGSQPQCSQRPTPPPGN